MAERPDPLAEPEGYGSKIPASLRHLTKGRGTDHPRVAEIQPYSEATLGAGVTPPDIEWDGGEDDTLCAWYDPPGGDPCGEEREWQIVTGDMAEHVCRLDLCDRHMTIVSSKPRFWCTECKRDMKLERVGAVVDGELVWLDENGWPGALGRLRPPERLF